MAQNTHNPPPPYSGPGPSTYMYPNMQGSQISIASSSSSGLDDLSNHDTVILIDDSFSMKTDLLDENGRPSNRWKVLEGILRQILPKCFKHDTDGVDIFFLNAKNPRTFNPRGPDGFPEGGGWMGVRHTLEFNDAFNVGRTYVSKNTSITPIVGALKRIIAPYMRQIPIFNQSSVQRMLKRGKTSAINATPMPKPLNIIVITDGEPLELGKDSAAEQKYVIDYLNALGKILKRGGALSRQVGIQFLQIGNDPRATAFLGFLDNSLKGQDFVDTHKWVQSGDLKATLQKILLGGLNPELDGMAVNMQGRFG